MNNRNGALSFEAYLENKQLRDAIRQANRDLNLLGNTAVNEGNRIDATFKKLSTAMGAYLSINAATGFLREMVRVRGEFQQISIAMETMIGNKEKADVLMSQLVETAARTPFGLQDIAQGAKQLLAYGTATEEVNGTLIRLGDIAAGLSIPLNDLIYLYGTSATQGRLMTQDLNQFAGRGVPIFQELAKVLGVNKDQIKDLAAEGKISFESLQKVIQNLTSEGGQFFNLMEKQSASLTGKISNLEDAWDMMLNDLGTKSEGVAYNIIEGLTNMVENYEQVLDIIVALVSVYGAYKAAVIVASVAETAHVALKKNWIVANTAQMLGQKGNIALLTLQAGATNLANAAQAALNRTILANPYAMAALALAGLIAFIYKFTTANSAAEKSAEALRDKEVEYGEQVAVTKGRIDQLIGVIKDKNTTEEQSKKSLADLQKLTKNRIDGLTVEAIRTGEATAAINEYVAALEKESRAKAMNAQFDENIKEIYRLEQMQKNGMTFLDQIKNVPDFLASMVRDGKIYANDQEWLQAMIDGYKKANDQIIEDIKELGSGINTEMEAIDKNLSDQTNQIVGKGKDAIENKIKDLQDKLSALSPEEAAGKLGQSIKAQIQSLEKSLESYSSKIQEFIPKGSLAFLEDQLSKLEEQLSKTPLDQLGRIEDLKNKIYALTQVKNEALKSLEVRTTSEMLDEKKAQYEEYEKWLLAFYGQGNSDFTQAALKTASSTAFSELTKDGATFAIYLERQLNAIIEKYTEDIEGVVQITEDGFSYIADLSPIADKISIEELKQLADLQIRLNEELGRATPEESFRERITLMKESYESEFEYLNELKDLRSKLNVDDPNFIAFDKILGDEIKTTTKTLADDFKSFVQSVQGSEAAIQAVIYKYRDLKAIAQEKGDAKTILEIEKKESDELYEQRLAQSKELLKFQDKYYSRGKKGLDERIKDLETEIIPALEKESKELDNSAQAQRDLNAAVQEHKELTEQQTQIEIDDWANWLYIITQAGEEMEGIEGVLGSLGGLLSGIGINVNKIAAAFQNAEDSGRSAAQKQGDAYAAAGEFTIWAITSIIGASKRRKEAEKNNLLDLQALQNTYNQAILEEIRLRTILNENVYFKDYAGRINDAIDSASESLKLYSDLLSKINDQEAKTGMKNVVDWNAVGKGAGTGAAAGATVGSLFGPIGAAIGAAAGAIIGGIVGLFSSKKKDLWAPLLEVYPELITAEGEINETLAQSLLTSNQLSDSTKEWLQSVLDAQDAYKEAKQQITDIVAELTGNMGSELHDVLVDAFAAGEDAATKFADTVEKTLSNMLSNLIFSAVFTKAFDTLQADIENAMMGLGGKSYQQIFSEFLSQSEDLTKHFNDLMKEAEEQGKKFGLDLFDPSDGFSNNNSLSGIARSITEETGSALVGQLNAVRMYNADMVDNMRKIYALQHNYLPFLEYLRTIEKNTRKGAVATDFSEFGG